MQRTETGMIGSLQARETYAKFVERMRAAYVPGMQ